MRKLDTTFLTREDLRLEDEELPIENISFYNFKIEPEIFKTSEMVIFYDNITHMSKIIKYRYVNKFV